MDVSSLQLGLVMREIQVNWKPFLVVQLLMIELWDVGGRLGKQEDLLLVQLLMRGWPCWVVASRDVYGFWHSFLHFCTFARRQNSSVIIVPLNKWLLKALNCTIWAPGIV